MRISRRPEKSCLAVDGAVRYYQAEQRAHYELADSVIKGQLMRQPNNKALRGVDLNSLRDRYGRGVLAAAIAEGRPREELAWLMAKMKAQAASRPPAPR